LKVEYNIERLKYLLKLYKMEVSDFLMHISEGLKNPIKEDDVFAKEIKVSHLKRIDKLFDKGIHYYLDPNSPTISKSSSIFFRKDVFNQDLNFGAKKIVRKFEEFKLSLSGIAKLAELDISRKIPVYKIGHSAKKVANDIRKNLYPKQYEPKLRDFLKSLISSFAANNILVFEFVETWNKKDKANINGFYLSPNVIVLKRQQEFFRREIFTLAHELGHYLLDKEEVEEVKYNINSFDNLTAIERWCNEFAYYFLAGKYAEVIQNLEKANATNDYHTELIDKISTRTHLSSLSLYTKLLIDKKLSYTNYKLIKEEQEDNYKRRKEERDRQRTLDKEMGKESSGRAPKPINSTLLLSTIQTAYSEGILNEYEVCRRLNIDSNKFESLIE